MGESEFKSDESLDGVNKVLDAVRWGRNPTCLNLPPGLLKNLAGEGIISPTFRHLNEEFYQACRATQGGAITPLNGLDNLLKNI